MLTKPSLRLKTMGTIFTALVIQLMLVISGILAARLLGVEDRGYLALLSTFPLIVSQLCGLGLNQALIYYLSQKQSDAAVLVHVLIRPVIGQMVALLSLHTIILWFYLAEQPNAVHLAAYITLLVGPPLLLQQYGLAILQAQGHFIAFNLLRALPAVGYATILVIILLFKQAHLVSVTAGWVLIYVLTAILTIFLAIRRIFPTQRPNAKPPSVKHLLHFGLKGLVGTTTPLETYRLDQLIAGLFLSPAMLGLYVVALAFTNLSRFVAQSASMVAYPTLAKMAPDQARPLLWRFFWIISGLNGLMTLIVMGLIPYLLPLFFGSAFIDAVPIAQILLLGSLMAASRRIFVEGLRGLGQPQISTLAESAMYPWLLISVPLLITDYDIKGLALAITIGYSLSLIIAMMIGVRTLSYSKVEQP